MGQKVHPVGFRLGVNKTWSSKWFAASKRQYASMVYEDILIREHIRKKFGTAGVSSILIGRESRKIQITIHSSRPGIIIGKKGAGADSLKNQLIVACKLKNAELLINVHEVKKPDIDAQIIAMNIRQQLVKRVSFRRAMKKAISSTMRAGAKGVKIQCSGRLGGADMSRVERYHEGRVPLHTIRSDIDYANAEALTTYGLIGIKVWVFKGEILNKDGSQL